MVSGSNTKKRPPATVESEEEELDQYDYENTEQSTAKKPRFEAEPGLSPPAVLKKTKTAPKTKTENPQIAVRQEVTKDMTEAEKGLYIFYKDLMKRNSAAARAGAFVPKEQQDMDLAGKQFDDLVRERDVAQKQLHAAQQNFNRVHKRYLLSGKYEIAAAEALERAREKKASQFKASLEGFREFQAAVMGLEISK